MCKRYGIDNSKRKNHTALIDCDLLAKVYINLIDQKEPTLNFQNGQNENTINIKIWKKIYIIKKLLNQLKKKKKNHKNI